MKKRATVFVGALLGLAWLLPTNLASAHPAGQEHYPDLQTLKPSEIRITRSCSLLGLGSCKKYLRFSNIAWNSGNGRLEMRPQNNASTDKTTAYQRVYSHDASGSWYFAREFPVGEFSFHESHNHWHFEGFANYSLVTARSSDTVISGSTKRSSQKTTFCVIDTNKISGSLEHAEGQRYTSCGQNDLTGSSVGWGDRYGWDLPGQDIDISGLPDGYYWLVSTVDFQRRLTETNDENNCGAAKIEIRGTAVYDRGQKVPC